MHSLRPGPARQTGRKTRSVEDRPIRVAVVTDAVLPWNVGGKERRLYEILSRLEPATIEPRIFTMKWWDGPSTCNEGGLVHEALLARKSLYTPIGRRSILEAVLFGMASLKLLWKRFDVIDVDSMPFFPVLAMKLMSIIRRKPLLATWHEVWGKPYWVTYLGRLGVAAAMVERLAVRCPDVIISNSEHTSRGSSAWGRGRWSRCRSELT